MLCAAGGLDAGYLLRIVADAAGGISAGIDGVHCVRARLNGSRAYFHALADGLMCADDKRLASSEISKESRALAAQMFRAPVESFAEMPWPRAQAWICGSF